MIGQISPPGVSFTNFVWRTIASPWHIGLGFVAFLISCLQWHSHRTLSPFADLKKNWKRLHRLVYLAALLGISHAIINTYLSKRQGFGGPEARPELFLYLAILLILLTLRLPFIRPYLRLGTRKQSGRATDLQTA